MHWRRCAAKHMEQDSLGCLEYTCSVLGSFFLPLLYVCFPSTSGPLPFFPSSARLLTSLKPQVSSHYTFLPKKVLCHVQKIFMLTFLSSNFAGKFALWMIPQLFAYSANFPIQKFLQSQGKVLVMAWISGVVLIIHAVFSWLFIIHFKWGLVGAAITLNTSWWLVVIGQLLYILITKSDGAWSGFSWLAFRDLYGFVKLSLASAVMLWYQFPYIPIFFFNYVSHDFV